tara:strand:+ start:154 stop:360 length:207 start_codon:yes stop_codon:yes gene_type:complete
MIEKNIRKSRNTGTRSSEFIFINAMFQDVTVVNFKSIVNDMDIITPQTVEIGMWDSADTCTSFEHLLK